MKREEISAFLRAIDDHLAATMGARETLDLSLLGRSALVLGYGFGLMTKDVDVVHVHGSELLDEALKEFGRNSKRANQLGFYLEDVSSGLPPLPSGYQKRCVPISGPWRVIRPGLPEIHDLAATKLSCYHARDREDLQLLCDTGDLTSDVLNERVDSAFPFATDDDDDPKRKQVYANMKIVCDYLEGIRRSL